MRLVAMVLAVATGCSESVDVGPRSTLTAPQAAAARAACTFGAGTLPGLSLAEDAPLGPEIPIDTIVIVMMENRSFDHLLGHLPQFGQPDVEVPPAGASNLASNGTQVPWGRAPSLCFCDTNHEWSASHDQYHSGLNDGFVIASEGYPGCPTDGARAMSFYTDQELPWLYGLASAYAISDRNFSSLLGPTFPNREYLYAATSYGMTVNVLITDPQNNLLEVLEKAKVGWRSYYTTSPGPAIFLDSYTKYLDSSAKIDNFYTDAQAGTLPRVSFVDPDLANEWGGGEDLHPPGDAQQGEAFLAKVVNAVTASPQWPHLALFITFDEGGGLYDHVPPPPACVPDDVAPMIDPGGVQAAFDRLGFRVPLVVVSPYAKPHYVSHVVSDHTSILRFVEARFRLGAMTKRDANADPLFDLFDFSSPKRLQPASLPTQAVDPQQLAACQRQFPNPHAHDAGADMAGADLASPPDAGTD